MRLQPDWKKSLREIAMGLIALGVLAVVVLIAQ